MTLAGDLQYEKPWMHKMYVGRLTENWADWHRGFSSEEDLLAKQVHSVVPKFAPCHKVVAPVEMFQSLLIPVML